MPIINNAEQSGFIRNRALKGVLEKRFWECKSLSERSGDPALRGFCGFGVRHAKDISLPDEWQAGAYGGKACRSEAEIPLCGAFAIFKGCVKSLLFPIQGILGRQCPCSAPVWGD